MRRTVVFAIVAAAMVAAIGGGVAHATTSNAQCLDCHARSGSQHDSAFVLDSGTTTFTVAAVDFATACSKCHWVGNQVTPATSMPYQSTSHNYSSSSACSGSGCHTAPYGLINGMAVPKSLVASMSSYFNSSTSYGLDAETLHRIHSNPRWPAQANITSGAGVPGQSATTKAKYSLRCASCHAAASCDDCHAAASVSPDHASHTTATVNWTVGAGTAVGDQSSASTAVAGQTCVAGGCHVAEGVVGATCIDHTPASVTKVSFWTLATGGKYYLGSAIKSNMSTAVVSFEASGAEFSLYGFTLPTGGFMLLSVDGSAVATIDCYASAQSGSVELYRGTLTPGTHTMTLTNAGVAGPGGGRYITFDYIALYGTAYSAFQTHDCVDCHVLSSQSARGIDVKDRREPHGYDTTLHAGSQASTVDTAFGQTCSSAGCHSMDLNVVHSTQMRIGEPVGCVVCHRTLLGNDVTLADWAASTGAWASGHTCEACHGNPAAPSPLAQHSKHYRRGNDIYKPITLISGDLATWKHSPATFSLDATDGAFGSGVASTHYTLDNGADTTYSGTVGVSKEGTTVVKYRSIDASGNAEATNTAYIFVDDHAPTITGAPTAVPNYAGWFRNPVTIHFTAADALSGLASASPDVVVSGEGDDLSASASATDVAGNRATATLTGIKIDLTPPVTASNAQDSYNGTATITLIAGDNLSGVSRTYYSFDGGATVHQGTTVVTTQAGRYNLSFWSVDAAGNVESHRYAAYQEWPANAAYTMDMQCEECHSVSGRLYLEEKPAQTTTFTAGDVDFATACAKCHWTGDPSSPTGSMPYTTVSHAYSGSNCNGTGCHAAPFAGVSGMNVPHSLVASMGSYFYSATSYQVDAETLHRIHASPRWSATVDITYNGAIPGQTSRKALYDLRCPSCHKVASCSSCHGSVGHSVHSPGAKGTASVGNGTPIGSQASLEVTTGESCTGSDCHSLAQVSPGSVVDNTSASITKYGTWTQVTGVSYSNGSAIKSNAVGGSIALAVSNVASGSEFSYHGFLLATGGSALVQVDGATIATVSCYSAGQSGEVELYRGQLTAGDHVISVANAQVAGKGGGKYVTLDDLNVYPQSYTNADGGFRPSCGAFNCHIARVVIHDGGGLYAETTHTATGADATISAGGTAFASCQDCHNDHTVSRRTGLYSQHTNIPAPGGGTQNLTCDGCHQFNSNVEAICQPGAWDHTCSPCHTEAIMPGEGRHDLQVANAVPATDSAACGGSDCHDTADLHDVHKGTSSSEATIQANGCFVGGCHDRSMQANSPQSSCGTGKACHQQGYTPIHIPHIALTSGACLGAGCHATTGDVNAIHNQKCGECHGGISLDGMITYECSQPGCHADVVPLHSTGEDATHTVSPDSMTATIGVSGSGYSDSRTCADCHMSTLAESHANSSVGAVGCVSGGTGDTGCHNQTTPIDSVAVIKPAGTWDKTCLDCHGAPNGPAYHGAIVTTPHAGDTGEWDCGKSGCHNTDDLAVLHAPKKYGAVGCSQSGDGTRSPFACHSDAGLYPTQVSCGEGNNGCHQDKTDTHAGEHLHQLDTTSSAAAGCVNNGDGCHGTESRTTTASYENPYHPSNTCLSSACHSSADLHGITPPAGCEDCHNSNFQNAPVVADATTGHYNETSHTATMSVTAYVGDDYIDVAGQSCDSCHDAGLGSAHTNTSAGTLSCLDCHNDPTLGSTTVVQTKWIAEKCTACHTAVSVHPGYGTSAHDGVAGTGSGGCGGTGTGCHDTAELGSLHTAGCYISACHGTGTNKDMSTVPVTCGGSDGACHTGYTAANHGSVNGTDTTHTATVGMTDVVGVPGSVTTTCGACHSSTLKTVHTATSRGNKAGCQSCHNEAAPVNANAVITSSGWLTTNKSCATCHATVDNGGNSTEGMHDASGTPAAAFASRNHDGTSTAANSCAAPTGNDGCHSTSDLRYLHTAGCLLSGCHAGSKDASMSAASKSCGNGASGSPCHAGSNTTTFTGHYDSTARHASRSATDTFHVAGSMTATIGIGSTGSRVKACNACHDATMTVAHGASTSTGALTCKGCHNELSPINAVTVVKVSNWNLKTCDQCHGAPNGPGKHLAYTTGNAHEGTTTGSSSTCANTGAGCHTTARLELLHYGAQGCATTGCHTVKNTRMDTSTKTCSNGASGSPCHAGSNTTTYTGHYDSTVQHASRTGTDTGHLASTQGTATFTPAGWSVSVQCNVCHSMTMFGEHTRANYSQGARTCVQCHNRSESTTPVISAKWPTRATKSACAACHGVGTIPAQHTAPFSMDASHTMVSSGCSAMGPGCHTSASVIATTAIHGVWGNGNTCKVCHDVNGAATYNKTTHTLTYNPTAKTCGNGRDCHNGSGQWGSYDPASYVHTTTANVRIDGTDTSHTASTASMAATVGVSAGASYNDSRTCGFCHSSKLLTVHANTSTGTITCTTGGPQGTGCHNATTPINALSVVKTSRWNLHTCVQCHTVGVHNTFTTTSTPGVGHGGDIGGSGSLSCASVHCHKTADLRILHAPKKYGTGCSNSSNGTSSPFGCHVSSDTKPSQWKCGQGYGGCHNDKTAYNHGYLDSAHMATSGASKECVECHQTYNVKDLHHGNCNWCHWGDFGDLADTVGSAECTACHNPSRMPGRSWIDTSTSATMGQRLLPHYNNSRYGSDSSTATTAATHTVTSWDTSITVPNTRGIACTNCHPADLWGAHSAGTQMSLDGTGVAKYPDSHRCTACHSTFGSVTTTSTTGFSNIATSQPTWWAAQGASAGKCSACHTTALTHNMFDAHHDASGAQVGNGGSFSATVSVQTTDFGTGTAWPAAWARSDTTNITMQTGTSRAGSAIYITSNSSSATTRSVTSSPAVSIATSATQVDFWYLASGMGAGNTFLAEVTTDGATFREIYSFTDTPTVSGIWRRVIASNLPTGTKVAVRLSTKMDNVTPGAEQLYIDDFRINRQDNLRTSLPANSPVEKSCGQGVDCHDVTDVRVIHSQATTTVAGDVRNACRICHPNASTTPTGNCQASGCHAAVINGDEHVQTWLGTTPGHHESTFATWSVNATACTGCHFSSLASEHRVYASFASGSGGSAVGGTFTKNNRASCALCHGYFAPRTPAPQYSVGTTSPTKANVVAAINSHETTCTACHTACVPADVHMQRSSDASSGLQFDPTWSGHRVTSSMYGSRIGNPSSQFYINGVPNATLTWPVPNASTWLASGWTTTSIVACSDCHGTITGAAGPHGATMQIGYAIRTGNTPYDNTYSSGTLYVMTGGSTMSNTTNLCYKCHPTIPANTAHSNSHHGGSSSSGRCTNCHSKVAHAWKRPRLLGYTTEPGGSVNLTGITQTNYTSSSWVTGNCTQSGCSNHSSLTGTKWP